MKDEEMAEEYKEKHICNTCADIQECGNDCPFSRCWVQGFLAGLKAGRPQWHNLRENPNDLPKEFNVIKKAFGIYPEEKTIHIVLNQDGEYVHYLSGDWYYIYDEDIVGDSPRVDVISWCEIPTFDKELRR